MRDRERERERVGEGRKRVERTKKVTLDKSRFQRLVPFILPGSLCMHAVVSECNSF